MVYKPLPVTNPPYKAPWVDTADALVDNVRALIVDVPAVRDDLMQATTRLSQAETATAANSASVESIRSDVRSLSGQISASTSAASQATQSATAAQTAAQDAATSASQSASQVAGMSSAVTNATTDIAALKTVKADRSGLSTVAFTGKWADLIGAPTGGTGGGVTVDTLPPGTNVFTTSTTTRPTTRTDIRVTWLTPTPPVALMLPVDVWEPTAVSPGTAPDAPGMTFTAADGSAWPQPWAPAQTPAGGGATVQGGRGRLVTGATGGYSGGDTVAMRYGVAANIEATFTFQLVTDDVFPRFVMRSDQASLDPGTGVVIGWSKTSVDVTNIAGYAYSTAATQPKTHTAGVDYRMRVSAQAGAVKARTWPTVVTEPSTWDVTATTPTTAAGYLGFAVGSGNAATSQTMTVDDVTLTTS